MNRLTEGDSFTKTSAFALFLLCGFSLFLTWLYGLLFVFPLHSPGFPMAHSGALAIYIASLIGFALGVSACRLFLSKNVSRKVMVLISATIGSVALGFIGYTLIGVVGFILTILSFMGGSVTGLILGAWVHLFTLYLTSLTPYLYGLSALIAVLTGYLFSTIASVAYIPCFIVSLGLSVAMLLYIRKYYMINHNTQVSSNPETRLPLPRKMIAQVSIYGLLFGSSSSFLSVFGSIFSISIALILGSIFAGLDMWRTNGVAMRRSSISISIAAMASLLFAAFLWPKAQMICWSAMAAVFAYVFIINANWVIFSAKKYEQNAATLYSRTQGGFWICFAGAWLGVWILQSVSVSTVLIICILLFLVSASSLLAAFTDFESLEFPRDQQGIVSSGINPAKAPRFTQACTEIASSHGLTPRESEVFSLLAKGRNAEVISNDLVISRYTAKTHIYHIYQKTGKSSQQDIIDMVEIYTRTGQRSA